MHSTTHDWADLSSRPLYVLRSCRRSPSTAFSRNDASMFAIFSTERKGYPAHHSVMDDIQLGRSACRSPCFWCTVPPYSCSLLPERLFHLPLLYILLSKCLSVSSLTKSGIRYMLGSVPILLDASWSTVASGCMPEGKLPLVNLVGPSGRTGRSKGLRKRPLK